MSDFRPFQGREFRDGQFRDVNGSPQGGATPPPQRKKPNVKAIIKRVAIVVVVLLVLSAVLGSYYNVSEQENAVVTMFGKVVRTDTAGLYFKIPYLQQVHMVDITTHGTGIGYSVGSGGQNITNSFDGIMITKDFNLINIDFYMEYKVSDPVAYLFNSHTPELILHNIALASIRSTVINYTVDEAMTTGKSAIQSDVKEKIVKELQDQDMCGGRYLVAPVRELHQRERQVYLPEGRWKDLNSGEILEGGHTVTAPAPIDVIPVYEKV